MKRLFFFPIILLLCSPISGYSQEITSKLPAGFVFISDVIPDVLLDIRYYSKFNFVGSRVDGYLAPVAILTQEATLALVKAADELRAQGYIFKIFDGYRPQKAVEHFVRWANDVNDTIYKRTFYPNVDKSRLFELMYIAARSGHSRGSTIDLTLVDMSTGKELDMGAPFDFFGPVSGHDTNLITEEQKTNRELLKNTMTKYGFKINNEEWWHYAFVGEPYPSTYFDFDVAM